MALLITVSVIVVIGFAYLLGIEVGLSRGEEYNAYCSRVDQELDLAEETRRRGEA